MRWVLRIGALLLALAGLAAIALWLSTPWVPPVQMTSPSDSARRVDGSGVLANLHSVEAKTPKPGIVLLGGSEGGLGAGADGMARALSDSGLNVLHLSYFRGPGQPEALELIPLETITEAIDFLKREPSVDPAQIGLVGVSKGAEAALLVAARRHDVRAVVLGLPSSVAWMGIDWSQGGAGDAPSWSWHGKPVPSLPYGEFDWEVGVGSVYIHGLSAIENHPDAIIPVERVSGPILLVCGEADHVWPSCPMARQIVERARDRGGPEVTLLAYPKAGHSAFGVPVGRKDPGYERLGGFGGTPEGNAKARADAWPQAVAFLQTHLTVRGDSSAGQE